MLHTCTLPGPGAILQIMMLFVPPLLGHDGDQLLFIMATAMTLSALFKCLTVLNGYCRTLFRIQVLFRHLCFFHNFAGNRPVSETPRSSS